ncbi:protocatechuate 3,4-dioxygenase subunit alpha [Pseudonocardia sp. RS010]|uniref:protocatechuate 3,4-dioxygenase subunit alpha n=1 Tax=Pseudonocardia sp. RS010 TaxID=3385979 RepID=UPI0039A0EA11
MSEQLPLTPSQTVGPYLRLGLDWSKGADVVPPGTPGEIVISGIVRDGAGVPVTDGLIETWQADPDGRFAHPDDPRGAAEPSVPGFLGFGRSCTDETGRWSVRTVLPGALPGLDTDAAEAPHLDVSVFARGLLDRVVTRIYFDGQPANDTDPVLAAVPAGRRGTLIAEKVGEAEYRFDIHLQGDRETVFLQV